MYTFIVGEKVRFNKIALDQDRGLRKEDRCFDHEVHSVISAKTLRGAEKIAVGHHQLVKLDNGEKYSGVFLLPLEEGQVTV